MSSVVSGFLVMTTKLIVLGINERLVDRLSIVSPMQINENRKSNDYRQTPGALWSYRLCFALSSAANRRQVPRPNVARTGMIRSD